MVKIIILIIKLKIKDLKKNAAYKNIMIILFVTKWQDDKYMKSISCRLSNTPKYNVLKQIRKMPWKN